MLRKFFKGITGETWRWKKSTYRVVTILLKNIDEWSTTAPDIHQIGMSDVRVIRNGLCAGLEAVLDVASELYLRFDDDFSTKIAGDFLIRDWFATMHLSALLYAAAVYRESGGDDPVVHEAFKVGLHSYAAMYEKREMTKEVLDSIFNSPLPSNAVVIDFTNKLTTLLGPPKWIEAPLLHARALLAITEKSGDLAQSMSWDLAVNTWIQMAHAGHIDPFERLKREEAERRQQAERLKREDNERREAERVKREEEARRQTAERLKREEAERRQQAEHLKHEEAERRQQAERLKREDNERREAERVKREEEAIRQAAERLKREESERAEERKQEQPHLSARARKWLWGVSCLCAIVLLFAITAPRSPPYRGVSFSNKEGVNDTGQSINAGDEWKTRSGDQKGADRVSESREGFLRPVAETVDPVGSASHLVLAQQLFAGEVSPEYDWNGATPNGEQLAKWMAARRSQLLEATDQCHKALEITPDNLSAQRLMVFLHISAGKYYKALERIASVSPQDKKGTYLVDLQDGLNHFQYGSPRTAEESFRKSLTAYEVQYEASGDLEKSPGYSGLLKVLIGDAIFRRGYPEIAERWWAKAYHEHVGGGRALCYTAQQRLNYYSKTRLVGADSE